MHTNKITFYELEHLKMIITEINIQLLELFIICNYFKYNIIQINNIMS